MKYPLVCAAIAACVAQVSCSAPAGDTAGVPSPGSGGGGGDVSTGDGGGDVSTGDGGGGNDVSSGNGGAELIAPADLLLPQNPWNLPVDTHPKSPQSNTITQWLAANGGWGTGAMQIDFSLVRLTAGPDAPFLGFQTTSDFWVPDCDHVPFPVPAGGALEGQPGYQCLDNGDCHLLVYHAPTRKLYEMWRADLAGGLFRGGCAAVWDMSKSYPPNLRGDNCTSADAGGFPIAPMLFSADEIFAGEIQHALRFILPNTRIRKGVYVHPATHSTGATSGGVNAPPYGVHFRLRADFPLATLPSNAARVVARAMQKYGMFLADGGNITLTAADDRFTHHKWSEVGLDSHALKTIKPTDMEVVDMGAPINYTGNCVRNP